MSLPPLGQLKAEFEFPNHIQQHPSGPRLISTFAYSLALILLASLGFAQSVVTDPVGFTTTLLPEQFRYAAFNSVHQATSVRRLRSHRLPAAP